MLRNPKQTGTNLFDCIPQKGPCPNGCNQCFYNRPGAFYLPIDRPQMPTREEVGDGILRVNSGHDSNINREYVIAVTKDFPKRFFNTSIPQFDFPGPVVYTANPEEERTPYFPVDFHDISNIMFVRLRVSSTNLLQIWHATRLWSKAGVPVVLTFMRYYGDSPDTNNYEFRKSIKNDYWCPKKKFVQDVLRIAQSWESAASVTMCGTPESGYCRDCLNCERFYYQAMERKHAT